MNISVKAVVGSAYCDGVLTAEEMRVRNVIDGLHNGFGLSTLSGLFVLSVAFAATSSARDTNDIPIFDCLDSLYDGASRGRAGIAPGVCGISSIRMTNTSLSRRHDS